MAFERPAFLGKGVFQWNALGYTYATEPPPELFDGRALSNANPWIVMAAVLERLKAGDFSQAGVLTQCLRKADSWVLAQSCAELLGDAAPAAAIHYSLDAFKRDLFEDDDIRYQINFAYTLYNSALLWAIPLMLKIYTRIHDYEEAAIIPILLSDLLEKAPGPVARVEQCSNIEEYRSVVIGAYEDLLSETGSDGVAVVKAELADVGKTAASLHKGLRSSDVSVLSVRSERHRFEASTGIDCSAFFRSGILQPLAATAIVEEFLEGPEIDGYQAGVRYFHGRRIPD